MLIKNKHELMPVVNQASIARECGVSRTTVAFAFNERLCRRVHPQTRQRILTSARQLGYQPNRAARALRSGRFNSVGLVIGDVMNMFYARFVRTFEQLLEARGYDLVVEDTHVSIEREKLCLERILARQVDGLFCFVPERTPYKDFFARQWWAKKPVVVMGPCREDLLVDSVFSDYSRGITQAVDHLVELGHRRIGFVCGLGMTQSDDGRIHLAQDRLRQRGLGFPDHYLIQCGASLQDGQRSFGEFLSRTPRADWPSAVIAVNDVMAIGLMRAALDCGLKVPEALSVIGVDNTPIAECLPIPLTSVDYPHDDVARQVIEFFIDRVRGEAWPPPRRKVFETSLVVRSSTAKAKS
ncbi:MAG: LacI family DNA-binding transcriptional regulator [Verrucomicrobia bacterium]|nr:LacI family DNA-binding transcriptional regulator [Verrucomicrobiota bacterium]